MVDRILWRIFCCYFSLLFRGHNFYFPFCCTKPSSVLSSWFIGIRVSRVHMTQELDRELGRLIPRIKVSPFLALFFWDFLLTLWYTGLNSSGQEINFLSFASVSSSNSVSRTQNSGQSHEGKTEWSKTRKSFWCGWLLHISSLFYSQAVFIFSHPHLANFIFF